VKNWSLLLLIGVWHLSSVTCSAQKLPLKPTRTISFTTDEGTNMDVDVSPDGKTLVFDLLGDLYTLPVMGGKAIQITQGLAMNRRPIWSQDGKKIAYLSDYSGEMRVNVRDISRKFHIVLGQSVDGVDLTATPFWTPDDNHIVMRNLVGNGYILGVTGSIISSEDIVYQQWVSAQNGETQMILDSEKLLKYNFLSSIIRFSDDGSALYYSQADSICKYDLIKQTQSEIAPMGRFRSFALSPNGRWWAYITDSNSKFSLIVSDLLNHTKRMLLPSYNIKYPFYKNIDYWPYYSFSHNSRFIFIGYGGKIHRINVETGDDRVIPFIAHVKVDAGPANYNVFSDRQDSVRVKYARSATTSPDGKHLVFSALGHIYRMDLPNGKPRLFAEQPFNQFQPVYSPDGKWIAYVSWSDTTGGCLWRVPASGGKPEQITRTPGQYQRPTWSPDGSQIAVVMGEPKLGGGDFSANGKLEIISVKNGDLKMITDTIPFWNQLAFSNDGNRIIYEPRKYPYEKTHDELLVSNNLEGTDLRRIAVGWSSKVYSDFISQRTLSPDGRYIVYSMGENLFLLPINPLTQCKDISDEKQKPLPICIGSGVDPFWENGGKILSWIYGNKFYRTDPERIIEAAEKKLAFETPNGNIVTVQFKPNQTIPINIMVPYFHAHGTIVLKNIRIITMHGKEVIEHGTIVIENGRFYAIGPANTVVTPPGAKVLDLSGTTVMPGMVDLHLHLNTVSDILPQQPWSYLVNLAFGVTTARDPASNFDSFSLAEEVASGQIIGPRVFTVGRPVERSQRGISTINSLEVAQTIVAKRKALGATYIKQYDQPNRMQREWLSIASKEAGLDMTNEGSYDISEDIAMIKDGSTGVEHNPNWGDVYNDVISFFAKSGVYFTPTLQVRDGGELARFNSNYTYWNESSAKLERFFPANYLKGILSNQWIDTTEKGMLYPAIIDAEIRKAGGRVTLGSHGNDEGIGPHNELWALKMGGLTNMEALQAATIMGAEGLGIQNDVGSIEVGKIADLIILNKNPLDDIHNSSAIKYVMKDGVLYDGDAMDELWPDVKKCPEWKLKKNID
jgi:Tol biopolymer transport system component